MQTFDYDQVQTKMNQLKVVFDSFNSRLKSMDQLYTRDMAKTVGALYGSRASAAISQWNHFTTSFVLFDKEFKELYDLVQQVSRNLHLLEEEAVAVATTSISAPISSAPSNNKPTTVSPSSNKPIEGTSHIGVDSSVVSEPISTGPVTSATTKYAPPSTGSTDLISECVSTKYAPPSMGNNILSIDSVTTKYAPPSVPQPIDGTSHIGIDSNIVGDSVTTGPVTMVTTKYAPPSVGGNDLIAECVSTKYAPPGVN